MISPLKMPTCAYLGQGSVKNVPEIIRQEDAEKMGVKDKEIIKVACGGEGRKLIFDDVVVRVNKDGATTMHIDTDESQAAGNPTSGEIFR